MWDVKAPVTLFDAKCSSLFYLNYVGCKDFTVLIKKEISEDTFYLNYVGCKGINSMVVYIVGVCFI